MRSASVVSWLEKNIYHGRIPYIKNVIGGKPQASWLQLDNMHANCWQNVLACSDNNFVISHIFCTVL
jgi:hypothetical protein